MHSFFFCYFRAAPLAYGGSQPRRRIRAAAAALHHSNSESKPHLRPTPQLMATLDPQHTEQGQGSNPQPHGSQSGSLTTAPQWGLPHLLLNQHLKRFLSTGKIWGNNRKLELWAWFLCFFSDRPSTYPGWTHFCAANMSVWRRKKILKASGKKKKKN